MENTFYNTHTKQSVSESELDKSISQQQATDNIPFDKVYVLKSLWLNACTIDERNYLKQELDKICY